ncbi:MAG TPA: hypothetical protein VJ813_18640 [Vicinamibacterales bacterium]|nr:hypothetical protein [Vicinamibacterales bacterium]
MPKPPPVHYELGPRVERKESAEPFIVLREQQKSAAKRPGQADEGAQASPIQLPPHRKLRVFTQDPATPTASAAVTELAVPYEPLEEGPVGSVIAVRDVNDTTKEAYEPVELDDLAVVMTAGLRPSTIDPRFAQQMTYALTTVTYHRFRQALGRHPQFSFPSHADDRIGDRPVVKLHVHPHAFEEDNAYYDPDLGAVRFGYTRANRRAQRLNQPGAIVFTSLSHDVVVHEMTHALLDGMRARFMLPTNADVDGFHEGFADLIALLQRFSYRELVGRAIADARGAITSRLLVDLARQFGETTGDGETPLRTAFLTPGDLDAPVPKKDQYKPGLEAHDMGAILLRAVFDAFRTVFDKKTEQLRSLAPADGARLPHAMVDLLAAQAVRIADQFMTLVIRAVDYCPPVDLRFGEYLRALLTADYDLIPDDEWGYREAMVRAFRRHGVQVEGVLDLSEGALLWRGPERRLPRIPGLSRRERDADLPQVLRSILKNRPQLTEQAQQRRRAQLVGAYVTLPGHLVYFGLATPSASKKIERPVVESVREVRRVGPDGTFNEDLVAEIVQRRKAKGRWFYGGSTIILSLSGVIRYVIAKNVMSARREALFHEYVEAAPKAYARCFTDDPGALAERLRCLHRGRLGSRF